MNLEELHLYDAYVPMLSQPVRQYTFEQACDLLRAGLALLGEQYLADLELHLSNRWVDVYETPGKTSGAFSWGTYKTHPYVLLNFNGTFSDIFTLAHEVGHSMHTFYSHKRHFAEASYPIFWPRSPRPSMKICLCGICLVSAMKPQPKGNRKKPICLIISRRIPPDGFPPDPFAEFEWQAHQRAER